MAPRSMSETAWGMCGYGSAECEQLNGVVPMAVALHHSS